MDPDAACADEDFSDNLRAIQKYLRRNFPDVQVSPEIMEKCIYAVLMGNLN